MAREPASHWPGVSEWGAYLEIEAESVEGKEAVGGEGQSAKERETSSSCLVKAENCLKCHAHNY